MARAEAPNNELERVWVWGRAKDCPGGRKFYLEMNVNEPLNFSCRSVMIG